MQQRPNKRPRTRQGVVFVSVSAGFVNQWRFAVDETVWRDALPAQMNEMLLSAMAGRKTRYRAVKFARWIVAKGLWWRTRKGFNLVRGSHKDVGQGLKENVFLAYLGFTQAKIRGAINALREAGVLEAIEGCKKRVIVNGHYRTPPVLYRFSETYVRMLREHYPAPAPKADAPPRKAPFFRRPLTSKSLILSGYGLNKRGELHGTMTPRVMPEPYKPRKPATGPLAGAIDRLASAVLGPRKPAVRAPEAIPVMTGADINRLDEPRDLDFNLRFPYKESLNATKWPKVFDHHVQVKEEVLRWLLEHCGACYKTHGIRLMTCPETGLLDHRIGFVKSFHLFEFKMRWGGLG